MPIEDAREVSLCVAAMAHACLRDCGWRGGFPLCLRLLREMHAVLLDPETNVRGRGKAPGEFRRTQADRAGRLLTGNARSAPPPADALAECLDRFEHFLHDDPEPTSPLLKAALAHAQFETIHPFLDGNGRIGRLLIVLQLVADGLLREPLLIRACSSRRTARCTTQLLNEVRLNGDLERWPDFFAEGGRQRHAGGADSAGTAGARVDRP